MEVPMANQEVLKQQVEEQKNLLSTDRLDMSFGEIMSMYERKEIIIKPAFQRYFRWGKEQQTRFIESILLGIPIPPIFVAETDDGIWELVDGLQRISTILSFFGVLKTEDEGINKKNSWELTEGDRIQALEGFTYETFPNSLRLNIKRSTCRVEILRWNGNYDMRYELFNRLNTGGSPLTAQEIRNCIYRDISTKFNDFLKKIVANEDFDELTGLSSEKKEQLYHEELALRFMSLYKTTPEKLKTSISQHMTKFMKNALEKDDFDYLLYENLFADVFKVLKPLGRDIFRQSDGTFATALYDVITIGIAENLVRYKDEDFSLIQEKIYEVRQDKVLLKFSRRGGNNQRTRIINRLKEARRIFGS